VVRTIFKMVGPQGKTINATLLALSLQGVPTARGVRSWSAQAIRDYILDDAYKAHNHQEVAEIVFFEILRSLDPECLYGSASTVCGGSTAGSGPRPQNWQEDLQVAP
jgi:hypothetical protein